MMTVAMGASCLAEKSKKYWGKEGTKKKNEQGGKSSTQGLFFLSFFSLQDPFWDVPRLVPGWAAWPMYCAGVLPHPDPVPACRGAQFLCLVLTADGAKALCKQQAVWRDFGWASAGRSDPSCSCGGMQRVKKAFSPVFRYYLNLIPKFSCRKKFSVGG